MDVQQFFIRWMIKTYTDVTPVYLGGSHPSDLTSCVKIFKGTTEMVRLLKYDHEEADDRMMFHINHAVNVDKLSRAIVASEDTDVFICLIYHFSRWIHFGMKELCVLKGQETSNRSVPVHDLLDKMDSSVIDIMPAVHALGCDIRWINFRVDKISRFREFFGFSRKLIHAKFLRSGYSRKLIHAK